MWPEVNITLTTGSGFAWQNAKLWQDSTRRAAILARFWAKVQRTDAKGCWLFLGPVYSHGYGVFTVGGRLNGLRIRAHRLAWLLSRGEIPDGHNVLHRCDTPRCVNPSHLFLGTQADNMHDAIRKGRKRAWGRQKLDAAHVAEIRRRAHRGDSQRAIAAAFQIARNTVSQIVTRKTWAHLPDDVVPQQPIGAISGVFHTAHSDGGQP